MKKEDFIKVLEVLEYTEVIERYDFLKGCNAIRVTTNNGYDLWNYTYEFDNDNKLINPKVKRLIEDINNLENKKQELTHKLQKLIILNN